VINAEIGRHFERQQEGAANASINLELANLKRLFTLAMTATPPTVHSDAEGGQRTGRPCVIAPHVFCRGGGQPIKSFYTGWIRPAGRLAAQAVFRTTCDVPPCGISTGPVFPKPWP
jgi:hypothetical protein